MELRSRVKTYREGHRIPRQSTPIELMEKKMEVIRQFLRAHPEYSEDLISPCFLPDGTVKGPFEAYIVTRAIRWVRAMLSVRLRKGFVAASEMPDAGGFLVPFALYENMERYMDKVCDQAFAIVAYSDGIRVATLGPDMAAFVAGREHGPYDGQLVIQIPQANFTTYPGGVS